MLALIVSKVLLPGVPFNFVDILGFLVTYPKYLISIDRDLCRLMVLFAMPTVVALSQCTGVRGWGCPSSLRVSLKMIPSLQFRKRAPSSASAVEATTNRRMVHNVKNAPFNLIGSPSFGDHPMKKRPHARLCAFVSERCDASEWTFKIMSDARNRMVASGCVAR